MFTVEFESKNLQYQVLTSHKIIDFNVKENYLACLPSLGDRQPTTQDNSNCNSSLVSKKTNLACQDVFRSLEIF